MQHTFRPLSEAEAEAIAAWRYSGEYAAYDIPSAELESSVKYMTNPDNGYFGVHHGTEFVGFCSIGTDGQVPGGSYDGSAIDVGAGMRPDIVGKGNGTAFLRDVVDFLRSVTDHERLRATIASWNERALRAAGAVGFEPQTTFTNAGGETYTILVWERE